MEACALCGHSRSNHTQDYWHDYYENQDLAMQHLLDLCSSGDANKIGEIIGRNPHIFSKLSGRNTTPLLAAIRGDSLEVSKLLLTAKVGSSEGLQLEEQVASTNVIYMKLLYGAGYRYDWLGDPWNPLSRAVADDNLDCVQFLLEESPDAQKFLSYITDEDWDSYQWDLTDLNDFWDEEFPNIPKIAVSLAGIKLLNYLADKGLKFTKQSLTFASYRGDMEVLEFLESRVSLLLKDISLKMNPLSAAIIGGHIEVVKYLLHVQPHLISVPSYGWSRMRGWTDRIRLTKGEQSQTTDWARSAWYPHDEPRNSRKLWWEEPILLSPEEISEFCERTEISKLLMEHREARCVRFGPPIENDLVGLEEFE